MLYSRSEAGPKSHLHLPDQVPLKPIFTEGQATFAIDRSDHLLILKEWLIPIVGSNATTGTNAILGTHAEFGHGGKPSLCTPSAVCLTRMQHEQQIVPVMRDSSSTVCPLPMLTKTPVRFMLLMAAALTSFSVLSVWGRAVTT